MAIKIKNKVILYLLIIIIELIGCQHEKRKDLILINPIDSIGVLSDSSYLSTVYSMILYDKKLFVSDYRNQRIIELTKSCEKIHTFGTYGHGPGELITSGFIFINGDSLYVIDEFNTRINVFNIKTKRYLKNYDFSKYGIRNSNFIVNNNIIFLSTPYMNYPISKFYGNKLIKSFGKWIFNNGLVHKGRSIRKIFLLRNKYILAIPESEPFFEIYDLNGNLLSEIQFNYIQYIKQRYKLSESKYKKDIKNRKSILLINDAFLLKEKLYLLLIHNNDNSLKEIQSNILCVLKIANDFSISKVDYFQLSNNLTYFTAICADTNNILSYSPETNKIYTFKVK